MSYYSKKLPKLVDSIFKVYYKFQQYKKRPIFYPMFTNAFNT